MNILSISSILPVPGYRKTNDFVFEFYKHYLKKFNQDSVSFILPIKYSNRFIKRILNDNSKEDKIRRLKQFFYNNFKVDVLTFLSTWHFANLHALLSFTLFFFNRKYIYHLINQNKINVVHAQYIFSDGMLAYRILKKYNIPYVITSHNELRYFDHYLSKRLALKILKHASCITPLNFLSYQTFLKYKLPDVHHIPLGFDKRFLFPKEKDEHGEVKIITIASLIKLKNIDKVIHALAMLKDKYNFSYTIIGEGPEKDNLDKIIKDHDLQLKIQLVGMVPHNAIDNILSQHDIFIMPSYFETFGRVYFEAMALKLPIICAKNSGIYGFFKEMKEGISVDHTNIHDIAEKLEILIADKHLRDQIGQNGHELVKNYTWENLALKYNTIYKESIK
jgi:glycosyltransferase involved in cell wall biosynthesis